MSNKVTELINTIFDEVYPIGSIYISRNNTSPSQLFGGHWIQREDTLLYGEGTKKSGENGGEATHTLTINEIPSHTHTRWTRPGGYAERKSGGDIICTTTSNSNDCSNKVQKWDNRAGNDQAHNNMPPYYTVNVWKKVASISDITGIYLKDVDNKFSHDCPHTVTYNSSSGFTQIRINEGNTTNTGSRYYMSIPFSAQPNNVTVSVDFYTTGMGNDDFGVRICDKKTMDSSGAYDSYGAWIITGQGRLAYGYGGRETANVKYGDYLGSVGNNIQYNYTMKISKNTAYYCLKRLDTGAIISEKTYTRTDTYQFSGQYYLYIGGGKFSTGSADKSVYIKNLIIG